MRSLPRFLIKPWLEGRGPGWRDAGTGTAGVVPGKWRAAEQALPINQSFIPDNN